MKREEKRQAEREAQKKASLERLTQAAEEAGSSSGSEEENSSEQESESEAEQGHTVKHTEESDSSESESENVRTSESGDRLDFNLDDDNDDLFTVKRTVLPDSESEEEDGDKLGKDSKEKKAQSKYALAKKLQKKKVKVNTKVTFDEEGEVIINCL